jgi:hypothetical protein
VILSRIRTTKSIGGTGVQVLAKHRSIDQMSVYGRALSAQEITSLQRA